MIEDLSRELSVLRKAVAYPNLSGAALHIGLSQPQLSRILAKLEKELGIRLLDRDAKRKSSWTAEAHRLAEVFTQTDATFKQEVHKITDNENHPHVRIGSLEGLIPHALPVCREILKDSRTTTVSLDIHDLSELEELYFKGQYDVILSCRDPGAKSSRDKIVLGFQKMDNVERPSEFECDILSTWEHATWQPTKKTSMKSVVSNSVIVRQQWLEQFGGRGVLPSTAIRRKGNPAAGELPVLVIASEVIPKWLWKKFVTQLSPGFAS